MAKRVKRRTEQRDESVTTPAATADEVTSSAALETPPERADAVVSAGDEAVTSPSQQLEGAAPNDEDIRLRAYHRYLERGGGDGQDFDDWLEAERELKGTSDR